MVGSQSDLGGGQRRNSWAGYSESDSGSHQMFLCIAALGHLWRDYGEVPAGPGGEQRARRPGDRAEGQRG